MDAAKSAEWLLHLATSAVFLIPGYLVVRFLQTTRETRTVDPLGFIWLYLTPPGGKIRAHLMAGDVAGLAQRLLDRESVFSGALWLLGVAALMGIGAAYAQESQIYWKILNRVKLDRLSPYITTWEEISDLSSNGWAAVTTKTDGTYMGLISSVTHHPHERALILTRNQTYPIRVRTKTGNLEPINAEYVWISGDEITTIEVYKA